MKSSKILIIWRALFASYCFISILFFNPIYADEILHLAIFSLESVLLCILFVYTSSYFYNEMQSLFCKNIFLTLSFFISPLLSAILLLALSFVPQGIHLTTYITTFIAIGILPAALMILWFVFNGVLDQINFINAKERFKLFFELKNEVGKVILKVKFANIICFEANDNYVITYFLDDQGNQKKTMDRSSLKKIEETMPHEKSNFLRIHKSFIVNSSFVEEISGKSQSYSLKIKGSNMKVPVSRGFNVAVFQSKI